MIHGPIGGKIMKTIIIKDEINPSLELNSAATEILTKINDFPDEEIIIDFSGVTFISRSFAQAYFSKKIKMDKNIKEINLTGEVKDFFNTIRKNFE